MNRLPRRWHGTVWLALTMGLAVMSPGRAYSAELHVRQESLPSADPLEGHWMASDPDGGVATRSVIHLYRRDGLLFGRIVRTFDDKGDEVWPRCERCPGDLRGKRFDDIEFIRDLRPTGKAWAGGSVLDLRPGPLQGTQASCDLTLRDDGKAVLHGYIGLRWLGRSSIWIRHQEP
jgi:hypothetical protein